ncbi:MAG: hypothetical protein ACREJS_15980, partial [Candidatus Rokuibacteriota bacterium]
VQRSLDVRYVGQNYEIELPFQRDPAGLRPGFEARHRQLYGYATGEGVECVNLRVVARLGDWPVSAPHLSAPHPALSPEGRGRGGVLSPGGAEGGRSPSPLRREGRGEGRTGLVGSTRAYFPETGEVMMPRHDRTALAPGVLVTGPAVIEDEWSTIVVYPGHRAAADAQGHLVIDLEGAP